MCFNFLINSLWNCFEKSFVTIHPSIMWNTSFVLFVLISSDVYPINCQVKEQTHSQKNICSKFQWTFHSFEDWWLDLMRNIIDATKLCTLYWLLQKVLRKNILTPNLKTYFDSFLCTLQADAIFHCWRWSSSRQYGRK